MKHITTPFVLLVFLGCTSSKSLKEIKLEYGAFEKETIKTKPLDYTDTPIYKAVKHHPDKYRYLDKVNVLRMAHISDGLFITGLMATPKKEGKYPVILYNRGGNQDYGILFVSTLINVMAHIASEGYIVVASNYRGNSRGEGTEQFGGDDINDIANLIKSMGEIEKADTSRVGLLGVSRGAMMNYLTLKENYTSNIKAVINIGGITDLETTIKYHPQIEDVANELIPDFKNNRKSEIEKRSAVYWANKLPTSVPILILHGMKDEHVNYSQIPPFTNELDKYNIPYNCVSFKNGNHGIKEYETKVNELIKNWFERYVKNTLEYNVHQKRVVIE